MRSDLLFIPGPVTVPEPVLAAMRVPLIDHRSPRFGLLLQRIAEQLRPIFGTDRSEILMLGSSGTGGLEAAIVNAFTPGDTILAAPIGVFGRRMIAIAQRNGLKVDILETEDGAALDPLALAEKLAAGKDRRYAGILLTHNETSTGAQCDMAAIAAIVRGHGALTIVDSISALGATAFRMDEWGYDIVVGASQKALAAPPGVAMIAVSERGWQHIEKAKAPRFYFDLLAARDFAKQGQTPWTPPVSILFALDAALELYHQDGAQAAYRRHAMYAQGIRAAFGAMGMAIFSKPGAHSPTVVAAELPQRLEAAAFLRRLRDECGLTLSGGQAELRGKIVRMGTMGAITQTDVLGAIGAIEIVLLESDVQVRVGEAGKAALSVFLESPEVTPGAAQKTDARKAAQTMETSR